MTYNITIIYEENNSKPFFSDSTLIYLLLSAVMNSDGYMYFLNALSRLYSKTDAHNLS